MDPNLIATLVRETVQAVMETWLAGQALRGDGGHAEAAAAPPVRTLDYNKATQDFKRQYALLRNRSSQVQPV